MKARQTAQASRLTWIAAILLSTILAVGGPFSCKQRGTESSEGEQTRSRRQPAAGHEDKPREQKIAYKLQVSPPDATVKLTHEQLGLIAEQQAIDGTLDLPLSPGTYHALVTAEGFDAAEGEIEVSAAKDASSITLSARKGELAVSSNPGVSVGATGTDGQAVSLGKTDSQGRLPLSTLPAGDYDITLSLEDYQTQTVNTSLTSGQQTEIKQQLQPLPGRLKLDGPAGLEVYQADQRLGLANEWIDLPAGEHELELRCRGYRNEHMTITIAPNRPVVKQSPDLMAEKTGPTPGEPWAIPELEMSFAHVPAGSFQMGADDGDKDEMPIHAVTLSQDFWLGVHEVTQQQYQAVTGENPSKFQGPTYPVERVSWHEAVSFCQKLTEQERQAGRLGEDYTYRLPTEAEWEYAARGGPRSRSMVFAGSNTADEVAWCVNNSDRTTHPVGQKQANELGLYDMTGNVWEWCQDWLGYYPSEPQTDPVGPPAGMRRVIRGGSYDYEAPVCRVGNRHYYTPSSRFTIIGFRVVLARVPQQ